MPGQPKKKETNELKLSSGKHAKVDEEDGGEELQGMFRLMVEYCQRMTEMLCEVWQFQQEEAYLMAQQFAWRQ